MISLKETINNCTTKEKSNWEKTDIYAHFIGRRISYIPTWIFLNLNFSANFISFIGIIFALTSFGFLCFGSTFLLKLIGWLFLYFWSLFDYIDGNIARFRKTSSHYGELWDAAGGYIAMFVLFFAPGIIAVGENSLVKLDFFSPVFYSILSGFCIACCFIPRALMHKKNCFENETTKKIRSKTTNNLFGIIFYNITSLTGLPLFLLLISIIFNLCNIFVLFYSSLNILVGIISMIKLLKK